METTKQEETTQEEQSPEAILFNRMWDRQQEYSAARGKLDDACRAISADLQNLADAIKDVNKLARALGGMVVEIPPALLANNADTFREKDKVLREIDAWIAATKKANEAMAPACEAIAITSSIFDEAEQTK